MSKSHDFDYHSKRAADERRLAETIADPKIAALHAQLAELYEQLVQSALEGPEQQTATA